MVYTERANRILGNIRKHNNLTGDAKVGVIACFGSNVQVKNGGRGQERDIIAIANTDDIDLDREVVVPSGADTRYFERNRAIFCDHNYDIANCIGALRSLSPYPSKQEQRGWKVHFRVSKLPNNPLPDDILALAREGILGVSLGFEPMDYGRPTSNEVERYTKDSEEPRAIVRTWRWLELSTTCMPCNISCRTQLATDGGTEQRMAKLDELVTKSIIRRESAIALGLPAKEKRIIVVPNRKRIIVVPDA